MQGKFFSKKATKIVFTIKQLLSNSDSSAVETRSKLSDTLVKPVLLYGCEIWGPEVLSYKTHFDKSTIEQVTQTLNVPWYTENEACRAELGRYSSYIYRHKGFPFMLLAKIRTKIRQPSLK